jgi:hypothetical protein
MWILEPDTNAVIIKGRSRARAQALALSEFWQAEKRASGWTKFCLIRKSGEKEMQPEDTSLKHSFNITYS